MAPYPWYIEHNSLKHLFPIIAHTVSTTPNHQLLAKLFQMSMMDMHPKDRKIACNSGLPPLSPLWSSGVARRGPSLEGLDPARGFRHLWATVNHEFPLHIEYQAYVYSSRPHGIFGGICLFPSLPKTYLKQFRKLRFIFSWTYLVHDRWRKAKRERIFHMVIFKALNTVQTFLMGSHFYLYLPTVFPTKWDMLPE